jgi:hypothetical protein
LVDQGRSWAEATRQCESTCSYVDTVATFAQMYGGGPPSWELLTFLNTFQRMYGTHHALLGQEFFQAVVSTQFQSRATTYPMVRCALICCNMCCKKVVDGIAKLLVPSDVQRLKSLTADLDLVEQSLHKAWVECAKLPDSARRFSVFGRYAIRCILKLTNKQKKNAFEVVEFESWEAIAQAFEDDLAGRVAPGAAASSSSALVVAATPSLADSMSPQWIASQAGFKVHGLYQWRGISTEIYELLSMNDDGVVFNQRALFLKRPIAQQVKYDDLKFWAPAKGKPQEIVQSIHPKVRVSAD